MPAILQAEDWTTWRTGTKEEAMAVLRQYADDIVVAIPLDGQRQLSPQTSLFS